MLLYKNRGQNTFNHFIYKASFSLRVYFVLAESKFISFSVLAVTAVMWVKPTDTFLPGLMNIWKLIKVLTFTDTFLKICNANGFVMRTVFQF